MTQPPVGPTPWPQQSPPRRGNRTLIIVLVVIVFAIVALAGTCAVVVGNLLGGSRAYFDAANDYLAALEDGDADAAYALLCPDVTATVSRDEFAAAVEDSERPTDRRMNAYFTSTTSGVTGHVVSGKVEVDGVEADISVEFEGDDALVCRVTASTAPIRAAVWPAGEVPR